MVRLSMFFFLPLYGALILALIFKLKRSPVRITGVAHVNFSRTKTTQQKERGIQCSFDFMLHDFSCDRNGYYLLHVETNRILANP